jgi:putative ABC transport system permease protein
LVRGLRLAAGGFAIGVPMALGFAQLIRGMLSGISPADPITYSAVCVLLFGVALIACWSPARKTAQLNPVSVLRQ